MSLERMSLCSVLIDRRSAPVPSERCGDPGGGEALPHEKLINARRFLLVVQPGAATQFPAKRIVDERPLVELAVDLPQRLRSDVAPDAHLEQLAHDAEAAAVLDRGRGTRERARDPAVVERAALDEPVDGAGDLLRDRK